MENNARRVQSLWHIQGCPLFPPRGPSSCSLALYGIPLVLRLGAILLSSPSPPFPGSTSSCSCLSRARVPCACTRGRHQEYPRQPLLPEPRNRPPIHPARASNHGGKGPCPNMWYKHNSTSARLRPGKDRSRSLRLGARVTGTVRFQMLLTCSGSAFSTPADSANYLCRFLTIWVTRGSGCPEA